MYLCLIVRASLKYTSITSRGAQREAIYDAAVINPKNWVIHVCARVHVRHCWIAPYNIFKFCLLSDTPAMRTKLLIHSVIICDGPRTANCQMVTLWSWKIRAMRVAINGVSNLLSHYFTFVKKSACPLCARGRVKIMLCNVCVCNLIFNSFKWLNMSTLHARERAQIAEMVYLFPTEWYRPSKSCNVAKWNCRWFVFRALDFRAERIWPLANDIIIIKMENWFRHSDWTWQRNGKITIQIKNLCADMWLSTWFYAFFLPADRHIWRRCPDPHHITWFVLVCVCVWRIYSIHTMRCNSNDYTLAFAYRQIDLVICLVARWSPMEGETGDI